MSGTGPGEIERDHGHHAVIESARQTFELSGWAPHQHQAPSENRPHHQRETLLHHLSYLRRRMYCRGHSHALERRKQPTLTARYDFSIKKCTAQVPQYRPQFLVALMQPKNSQRKNISKPKENLLHRILTTSRKSLILNGEMNREYDAADLRYVSAMISNGNNQMWIKREGV
ncbi:hypothetical protein [Hoylesella pleuritidis]|uniref:hypothetical protein n=1 Tax=Hoylesella pleuritidis TaxID=407975 RepID=UPI0028E2F23F|nr:hypothetical protein [Hoylesella pleuritidis]